MSSQFDTAELRRLQWRCRRGMRELDIVFSRYLSDHYVRATAEERHGFLQLIETEDADIYAWLMHYALVPPGPMSHVITRMRELLTESSDVRSHETDKGN